MTGESLTAEYIDGISSARQLMRASLSTLGARNAALRGTITTIEAAWLATVQWDNAAPSTVNAGNLCKPRSVSFIE